MKWLRKEGKRQGSVFPAKPKGLGKHQLMEAVLIAWLLWREPPPSCLRLSVILNLPGSAWPPVGRAALDSL
jgi:hypothetical protein